MYRLPTPVITLYSITDQIVYGPVEVEPHIENLKWHGELQFVYTGPPIDVHKVKCEWPWGHETYNLNLRYISGGDKYTLNLNFFNGICVTPSPENSPELLTQKYVNSDMDAEEYEALLDKLYFASPTSQS